MWPAYPKCVQFILEGVCTIRKFKQHAELRISLKLHYNLNQSKFNYYIVRFSGLVSCKNILASDTAANTLKNWICLIMIT